MRVGEVRQGWLNLRMRFNKTYHGRLTPENESQESTSQVVRTEDESQESTPQVAEPVDERGESSPQVARPEVRRLRVSGVIRGIFGWK